MHYKDFEAIRGWDAHIFPHPGNMCLVKTWRGRAWQKAGTSQVNAQHREVMTALWEIFSLSIINAGKRRDKEHKHKYCLFKKKKKICVISNKGTMVVGRKTGATVFYLYCSTKSSMQPQTGNMPGGGGFDLPAGGRDPLAVKQHPLHPGSDLCIQ